MLHLFRTLLGLAWALWFGGVIALFIFATAFFNHLGREQAPLATGVMFPTFERYHLVLAAVALVATVGWRLAGKSRPAAWTFAVLAVATLAAITSAAFITPKIMALREANQIHSPEFRRTHGLSMAVYTAEAAALLAAGLLILLSERTNPTRARAADLAPAPASSGN